MIEKAVPKKIYLFIGLLAIFFVFIFLSKPAQAPVSNYNNNKAQPSSDNLQLTTRNLQTTTLFFAGDIMLSRNVADKIYKANDFTLPFKNISEEISKADIAFANLESPFLNTGKHNNQGLVFNADPQSILGLKTVGFDILSTANNHALDQGIKGLDFTLKHLIDNRIIPTGATNSKGESVLPTITKNELTFGFLSYSYAGLNDESKTSSIHVNNFNDLEKLKADIIAMKGHTADIVIVSMHAGTEYTRTPTPAQVTFAHAAIDAGADLVIGSHPHWIQTIEKYNDKWIFYSLGNFVFDQMWSTDTREGLTVFITYENEHIPDPSNQTAGEDRVSIKKIELRPVIIEDYCCPRWVNKEESLAILKKINLTSPVLIDKNEEVK